MKITMRHPRQYRIVYLIFALTPSILKTQLPLAPIEPWTTSWLLVNWPETDKRKQTIQPWAIGYYQQTTSAFDAHGKKTDLAYLLFGATQFTPQQAFAYETLSTTTYAPISFLRMKPHLSYQEGGISLGVQGTWDINEHWSWGVFATMPVLHTKIHFLKEGSHYLRGNLSHVAKNATVSTPTNSYGTFAYRFDFLAQLPYACSGIGSEYPIVRFHDNTFPTSPITISAQDITDNNNNPVYVTHQATLCAPSQPWGLPQATVQALPALAPSGVILVNGAQACFDDAINYQPFQNETNNQSHLWLSPSIVTSPAITQASTSARIIRDHVTELLACIPQEAEDMFTHCGLSFQSVSKTGCGDLDAELLLIYYPSSQIFLSFNSGFILPTGTKYDPWHLCDQPLGDNGHTEFVIGSEIGYIPWKMLYTHAAINFTQAIKKRECVSAPLAGSTVTNLTPLTNSHLSWNTTQFSCALYLVNPEKPQFSLTAQYDLYYKSNDHYDLCKSRAPDCLGHMQPLDVTLLNKGSSQIVHSISFEGAYNHSSKLGSISVGVHHTLAGKNAPRLTRPYGGITLYF